MSKVWRPRLRVSLVTALWAFACTAHALDGCESPLATLDLGDTSWTSSAAGFPFLVATPPASIITMDAQLASLDSEALLWPVAGGSGPSQLMDGNWYVFLAFSSAMVTSSWRIDALSGTLAEQWTSISGFSSGSGGCSGATTARPALHRLEDGSAAFQSTYDVDLVYSASRLDSSCTTYRVDNTVSAFNAQTGSLEWTFNGTFNFDVDRVYGLVIDRTRDRLFATTEREWSASQDSVWAINVLTGTSAWSFNAGRVRTRAAQSADRLYVATMTGNLVALAKNDGANPWTLAGTGAPILVDPVRGEGAGLESAIFVLDFLGRVRRANDLGTEGEWAWTTQLPLTLGGTLPAAALAIQPETGRLFASADDGVIHVLDAASGSLLAERRISEVPHQIRSLNVLPSTVRLNNLLAGSSNNDPNVPGAALFCTTPVIHEDGFEGP